MAYLVGISGGSGSGKTTLGRELQKAFGFETCKIVYQDSYYLDQSEDFDQDGGSINFDHPESLDFSRMLKDLEALKRGDSVHVPIYDFATHKREERTRLVSAAPVILLDGILIYTQPKILELLDQTVFVDTPESIRFQRRLKRDVEERGRTPEGVKNQFEKHVKPMHDQFVEPSKKAACLIVSGEKAYELPIREIVKGFQVHSRSR